VTPETAGDRVTLRDAHRHGVRHAKMQH